MSWVDELLHASMTCVSDVRMTTNLSQGSPQMPASVSGRPGPIASLLHSALSVHLQGHMTQARTGYEQVLALEPCNFDALHLLGVLALQQRDPALAERLIARALKKAPKHAPAWNHRGVALKELKRFKDALDCYEQALLIDPNFSQAHCNKGVALKELGRLESAVACYEQALQLQSDYPEALSNRGNALHQLGRLGEALDSIDAALALRPQASDLHINRGIILQSLGLENEALASFERAVEMAPGQAQAHFNRGNALRALRRFDEAVHSYKLALTLEPDSAPISINLGVALQAMRRTSEALEIFDRLIALDPKNNQACVNRAVILQESHRLQEAIAQCDQLIERSPDLAPAHWNKAIALLLLGDFDRGWPAYEWRWRVEGLGIVQRSFVQPQWFGQETLAGKTILLHAEQGLGDTLQFCRYATPLHRLGARVLVQAPAALLPLLQGLPGVDQLLADGQDAPAGLQFDLHCPMLSLPLAFRTRPDTIPSPGRYLPPSVAKLQSWRGRLGPRTKPRIGLVWRGSTLHKNDGNRSLALAQLLAQLPERFDFYSLQKEIRSDDSQALLSSGLKHFGDLLQDWADTAALCDLMDLVISVDTAVAHLAGALGKATWILLPYAPDWRWMLGRSDSPWYASARLYRQERDCQWDPVLRRVQHDLLQMPLHDSQDSSSGP